MIPIDAQSEPFTVFTQLMEEARQTVGIREPTAMTVATVGTGGEVHARVVLCKSWSEEGFVFYTNYHSQKGLDLELNPQAAAAFYWDPMFRQVDISGTVQRTSRAVSEQYWNSRPRESQLSQWSSRQSEEIVSREALEAKRLEVERKFDGREIPCPEHWGGYVLSPQRIEFWFGRPNRLHDRFEFRKSGAHWTFRRLYP